MTDASSESGRLQRLQLEASASADIDARIAAARHKTQEALAAIAEQLEYGDSEAQATRKAQQTLKQLGAKKFWHPCHVRLGGGTALSFKDPASPDIYREDDLFYVDIGPIWDGIEGDAGRTYYHGQDPEKRRCVQDVEDLFETLQALWKDQFVTGRDLYHEAGRLAAERQWVLAPSYVQGHRLSEFPHRIHAGQTKLADLGFAPSPYKWVLEVHICRDDLAYGAFFEDLLI